MGELSGWGGVLETDWWVSVCVCVWVGGGSGGEGLFVRELSSKIHHTHPTPTCAPNPHPTHPHLVQWPNQQKGDGLGVGVGGYHGY